MDSTTAAGKPAARRYLHLLDYDPDLAVAVSEERWQEVYRTALAGAQVLPRGVWDEPDSAVVRSCRYGLLVLQGLLIRTVEVADDRISAALIGPGDIIWTEAHRTDPLLRPTVRWEAPEPVLLAMLDDRFLVTMSRCPEIVAALIARGANQNARSEIHRAISQLPRVEDRVEALMWLLAERWGRITPNGVVVPVRLTHKALSQLVGARRPSITAATRNLAARGILSRRQDHSWLLQRRWPDSASLAEFVSTGAGFLQSGKSAAAEV